VSSYWLVYAAIQTSLAAIIPLTAAILPLHTLLRRPTRARTFGADATCLRTSAIEISVAVISLFYNWFRFLRCCTHTHLSTRPASPSPPSTTEYISVVYPGKLIVTNMSMLGLGGEGSGGTLLLQGREGGGRERHLPSPALMAHGLAFGIL